jgi:hypothetical protein
MRANRECKLWSRQVMYGWHYETIYEVRYHRDTHVPSEVQDESQDSRQRVTMVKHLMPPTTSDGG